MDLEGLIRAVRLCACVILSIVPSAAAQSIFTVAGGADLDGRPAVAFPLTEVKDVAVDSGGNIYISDSGSFRVRKVSGETGLIATVAGNGAKGSSGDGGPATRAAINPSGLAVDAAGNLHVVESESLSESIRRVDSRTGVITTVAVASSPEDITLDSRGNLFIADVDGVHRVDASTGSVTQIAGGGSDLGDGGPATAAQIPFAKGVAIDESAGALYIADAWNHRVRKVDLASGTISTVAGGGTSGADPDGQLATEVPLVVPDSVDVDPNGDVLLVDSFQNIVFRVDMKSALIFRVAGTGGRGFSGDGGAATEATLMYPGGISVDRLGNLYIADTGNGRVRKVDSAGIIRTVAGTGVNQGFQFVGDGGPGTAATLFTSSTTGSRFNGLALDDKGNLYIADGSNYRVRKFDTKTTTITTVAGTGHEGLPVTGIPATQSDLQGPAGIAVDVSGNLYLSDGIVTGSVLRVDAITGLLSKVPEDTNPPWRDAAGLAVDREGNVFVADTWNYVWKFDPATGKADVYAGNDQWSYPDDPGDDGPATMAGLSPQGLALDSEGNLYVADRPNNRIRKVDRETGIITTVAGSGRSLYEGDGRLATETALVDLNGVAVDALGNIFIAETRGSRIDWVDASTGILWTIAGRREGGDDLRPLYSGDNGPAVSATLSYPEGVAASPDGDIFILDTNSNRVRVIYACRDLSSPVLNSPSNGSTGLPTAPALTWRRVDGAFRYDVYLDETSPPTSRAGIDIETTSFALSNLEPLTTYYWRVEAKGDPFCEPSRSAVSEVRSFTTASSCDKPADSRPVD